LSIHRHRHRHNVIPARRWNGPGIRSNDQRAELRHEVFTRMFLEGADSSCTSLVVLKLDDNMDRDRSRCPGAAVCVVSTVPPCRKSSVHLGALKISISRTRRARGLPLHACMLVPTSLNCTRFEAGTGAAAVAARTAGAQSAGRRRRAALRLVNGGRLRDAIAAHGEEPK
jgi:hypothetical protein